MEIYLVIHKRAEDTNAFFSSPEKAIEYITRSCETYEMEPDEWKIVVLQEGKQFCANMSDFFDPDNAPSYDEQ